MSKIKYKHLNIGHARKASTKVPPNHKLVRIGSGAGGTVYLIKGKEKDTRKPAKVVKVFSGDVGYYTFIEELLKLKKSNPWLPKIYSATLNKLDGRRPKGSGARAPRRWCERSNNSRWSWQYSGEVVMEKLNSAWREFDKEPVDVCDVIYFALSPNKKNHLSTKNFCLDTDFHEAIVFLRKVHDKICKRTGTSDYRDIHDGNLMLRKDGQVVIIDPFN